MTLGDFAHMVHENAREIYKVYNGPEAVEKVTSMVKKAGSTLWGDFVSTFTGTPFKGIDVGGHAPTTGKADIPVDINVTGLPKQDVDVGAQLDQVLDALLPTETGGSKNPDKAVGHKTRTDTKTGKEVEVRDKNGKRIRQSYGAYQFTIPTAKQFANGELDGLNDAQIIKRLENRDFSRKLAGRFISKLENDIKRSKYGSKFSARDVKIAAAAAYNFKGEGFVKSVLDKVKPESMEDLLARHTDILQFSDGDGKPLPKGLPGQTLRQIKEFSRIYGGQ
jgi:hypothetical protein